MIDDHSAITRRERFELVAAEVFEPVQRYVRRRVDPHSTDDIVSETMLTLWRRLDDLPCEAVSAWAYGVARRQIANHRRMAGRHLRLVSRMEAEPRPLPALDLPLDSELHEALDGLREADREILQLWAWEQLEPGEIAVVLGLTPNAASIRLHRAKKKLGENLEVVRKAAAVSGHSHGESRKEERS